MEATTTPSTLSLAYVIGNDGRSKAVLLIDVDRYGVHTVVMPDGAERKLNAGHVFATGAEAETVAAERRGIAAMCEAQRGGSFGSNRAYQGD